MIHMFRSILLLEPRWNLCVCVTEMGLYINFYRVNNSSEVCMLFRKNSEFLLVNNLIIPFMTLVYSGGGVGEPGFITFEGVLIVILLTRFIPKIQYIIKYFPISDSKWYKEHVLCHNDGENELKNRVVISPCCTYTCTLYIFRNIVNKMSSHNKNDSYGQ